MHHSKCKPFARIVGNLLLPPLLLLPQAGWSYQAKVKLILGKVNLYSTSIHLHSAPK